MATINFSIEVSEDDFKDYFVNEIKDLPKDKIQELLLKAVEVALIQDKNNPSYNQESNILIESYRENVYGGSVNRYKPTALFNQVMKELPTDRYLTPIVEEISNYIKENYVKFIKEYIIETFTKMLFAYKDRLTMEQIISNMYNK